MQVKIFYVSWPYIYFLVFMLQDYEDATHNPFSSTGATFHDVVVEEYPEPLRQSLSTQHIIVCFLFHGYSAYYSLFLISWLKIISSFTTESAASEVDLALSRAVSANALNFTGGRLGGFFPFLLFFEILLLFLCNFINN